MNHKKPRVIAIGEVLWDLLPTGAVMGGAPANFAIHAHALGADANLVTCVGDDELGRRIVEKLEGSGFPVDLISIHPRSPTGTVSVKIGTNGHPDYIIHENAAWDFIIPDAAARKAVMEANVICFGTLAQRGTASRQTIHELVKTSPATALRICDINLRAPYISECVVAESLALANVLKLNDTELSLIAEMFELEGGDQHRTIRDLAERFDLKAVALTRGEKGSLIMANGLIAEHSGVPSEVRDTIGAGDSFTAAMAMGFVYGWPLDTICAHANAVAAYVCSQPGATPALPSELRKAFLCGAGI